MQKHKSLLYVLMIGIGVGLTSTFTLTSFPLYVRIIGLLVSITILVFGMIGNYRFNHNKG